SPGRHTLFQKWLLAHALLGFLTCCRHQTGCHWPGILPAAAYACALDPALRNKVRGLISNKFARLRSHMAPDTVPALCYSASTIVTLAMPPPSHMVCRP